MKSKNSWKNILNRYRHAWIFLYGFIYMPWFLYLEKRTIPAHEYFIINSPLDKYIPFCEYFVIPYLFWFAFMVIGVMYFFFTNRKEFYQVTGFLIIGMTIFLIISTVFPNGLHLRPTVFPRDNLFTDMVKNLVYANDTSTNVLPSIHAFNSLGISIAVARSESLRKKYWVQIVTHVLTLLILVSTVCLKQHSITDVIAAMVMAGVIYPFVYVIQGRPKKETKLLHQPI